MARSRFSKYYIVRFIGRPAQAASEGRIGTACEAAVGAPRERPPLLNQRWPQAPAAHWPPASVCLRRGVLSLQQQESLGEIRE